MEGTPIQQVYIGSCTNGRIEDLREAAKVLEGKTVAESVRLVVSPATPDIFKMALKEGLIDIFMEAGACLTNPDLRCLSGNEQRCSGIGRSLCLHDQPEL